MTTPVRRLRLLPVGFRNQVLLAYASAALLVSLLAGVIVWSLASSYMIEQRERTLGRQAQASASLIEELIASGPEADLRQRARDIASLDESRLLVVRQDEVVVSVRLTKEDLPPRLVRLVEDGQGARQRIRLDDEPRLVQGTPLRGDAEVYEAFPLLELEESLRYLSAVLAAVAVAMVALTALLGAAVSRSALRPLDEMIKTAQAVAAGDLSRRMVISDPDLEPIARSFNDTLDSLERRTREGVRFAGNLGHELRTPLTTLANAAAVLSRRRDQLPTAAREAATLLVEEVARFQQLVLDLLEILVLTEGRSPELRPMDLRRLLVGLSEREGWPVELPAEPVVVCGDGVRLERVLVNLVRNAEKHGGGLLMMALSQHAGIARVVVDDTGPGVPPEDRHRIFERFDRGTRPRERGTGFGLGLSLVNEIVRLHKGAVWVEGRPGGGARFVVELPVAP